MRSKLLLSACIVTMLAGCGSPGMADYAAQAGQVAAGVSAMSISSAGMKPLQPSTQSNVQDQAAAQAGWNSDSWTSPALLNAFDDPASDGPAVNPLPANSPVPGNNIHVLRFAEVNPQLYRGGLPAKSDLAAMKQMGFKTDVDLMGEILVFDTFLVWREHHWANETGIGFQQVEVPTGKLFWKMPSNAVADQFLKVVLNPANQPCYIHCLHGRDRTGAMAAVYRIAHDHYTNAQALAEMETFGFNPDQYPALAHFVESYQPDATARALVAGAS